MTHEEFITFMATMGLVKVPPKATPPELRAEWANALRRYRECVVEYDLSRDDRTDRFSFRALIWGRGVHRITANERRARAASAALAEAEIALDIAREKIRLAG